MAIVQEIDLNLIPDSSPVIVHVDQYDEGTGRLRINLYDGDVPYTPSNATVVIQGTKPDKKGFAYAASISGSVVTSDLKLQMTACPGRVRVQVVVSEGLNRTGTFVFWLEVQASALADDVDISETQLPEYINAAESAARDSEAYAVGKREGIDVGSTDPAYHNNSKYYATEAADSASDASGYATDASGYADDALGYKNDASGYASDALGYRNAAQAAATAAEAWSKHPPYIGQNGNWWVYNTVSETFVDSGVDASITLEIADVTMLAPGATPYVTNTGTNTDAVFHLFIPRGADGAAGNGIASITLTSGTHAPGTLDTYTITYTDGTTETIQIYNGADGAGSGDMTKAVYDPNNTVATDGGIVAYVTSAISGKANSADLATVATSGDYDDLSNKPTIPAAQVNSDWNASSGVAEILNKPTIPAAQVNSDWDAISGVAQILNKPTIPTVDQTYDGTSANAQSGVAIASAISGIQALGTKVTATVSGSAVTFTNAAITNTCVIIGPFVENVLVGLDSASQSGTSVTFNFVDASADTESALIYVREP